MSAGVGRRRGDTLVPQGRTGLREGDRIAIIGPPARIDRLRELYGAAVQPRIVS